MDNACQAAFGGDVFACGGGGQQNHGELMGRMVTTLNHSVLVSVDELSEDPWVTTITVVGTPAAPGWKIRPIDYTDVLWKSIELSLHPIVAATTGQNGYSITLNGWIQSPVPGVKTLDVTGDVCIHPIGELSSLRLTIREGYKTIQVISGGSRARHGHLLSINIDRVDICDDVLRDISVRSGGFIALTRNSVELGWVREHAVLGVISLALDPGRAMEEAGASRSRARKRVTGTVVGSLGGEIVNGGPLVHEVDPVTKEGWGHGAFWIGEHIAPYLNEYMAIDGLSERVAAYPDIIPILREDNGLSLAVKGAVEGCDMALVEMSAARLPLPSSAVDHIAVGECEGIMGVESLKYLPERRETPDDGTCAQT